MPGTFSKTARPPRPGAYFDWAATPPVTVPTNIGAVVLVAGTHDWGPDGVVVTTSSLADFQAKFGPTNTTDLYRAVYQAYVGEGLPGRGGAGQVLVYRMAVSTAAPAVKVLSNSTVPAITLTARYKGPYGNRLSVITQANSDGTHNDLLLLVDGVVVESYTYLPTDITALAALINSTGPLGSHWVSAGSVTSGGALVPVGGTTGLTFASGADTGLILTADYTAMFPLVESSSFSVFVPANLSDTSIMASMLAWASGTAAVPGLNRKGKRFMVVVGGALNESISTAATRATGLADENFITLGVGSLIDSNLGVLSTAQLAPRVAGILAARGEAQSITFARLANTSLGVLPSESDILKAFNAGVIVFAQDSNADAPIRIEKALTTYIGADSTKPYLIYRNPKFLRTMHGIELEVTNWAATNVIGQLQVNDATRAFVVGHAKEIIQRRADLGVIQPGFSVSVDPSPPVTPTDEFVALIYGIAFGRSIEQIYNLVYVA